MKTIHYRIASKEGGSYHPDIFGSAKAAKAAYVSEYKERNKKDGYDKYWQTKEMVIQKVTTIIENV